MPTDTTPFDTFAQVTGKLALSPSGETHTEDKISVNARRIDFWFRADPAKAPAPGILGKMTGHGIHILEFYHQPPGLVLWRECMQKQMALYTRESGEFPTLWVISGGRPDTLIEDVELRKSKGWPKGFYETAPGYRARLVVTSELPEIRETLLLRLWSAGKTLKRAQAELRQLPKDAWEWQVVREAVVALAGTPLYAQNQEGLAMIEDYRKVVDAWKEEVRLEGESIGIAKGESIGIAKGEAIGIAKGESIGIAKGESIGIVKGEQRALHDALEAIYTSRFGVLPDSLRNRLQEIQTVDRLRVLIGVFVSRPQGEVDALIQG